MRTKQYVNSWFGHGYANSRFVTPVLFEYVMYRKKTRCRDIWTIKNHVDINLYLYIYDDVSRSQSRWEFSFKLSNNLKKYANSILYNEFDAVYICINLIGHSMREPSMYKSSSYTIALRANHRKATVDGHVPNFRKTDWVDARRSWPNWKMPNSIRYISSGLTFLSFLALTYPKCKRVSRSCF